MQNNTALISNINDCIFFKFNDRIIRFKAPYSLDSIKEVTEWDNGYLVVNAKYSHSDELIEDYIDLKPILSLLYIDVDEFLAPIKKVEVEYAG